MDRATAVPKLAGRREWLGLVVLGLPTMLIGMDFSVLHLAVPRLAEQLRPSSTELLWIVDVYGFLIAGFLVTMGTLGDRIGRRRLLLMGGAAFGVASVLAAFAVNAEMLIATRALLGIAGATLMPSTLSLIRNMFHDAKQRRVAISVWMTNFMAGGAIGPVVGGLLLGNFWWGSVFLVGVPVMVLLLVFGPLLLPEYRDPNAGRIDLISVVLSLAAILPIVYGIKEIATHGFANGFTVVPVLSLVVGLVAGAIFLRRQRRLADPVLDVRLFANRSFTVALATQGLILFAISGVQYLFPQYLQVILGLSPLAAGIWLVPAMAAGILGTLAAPVLARWFRSGPAIAVLLLISLPGLAVFAGVGIGAGLVVIMAGFTYLMLVLNPAVALSSDLIIANAPPERAGSASGVSETSSELGIALGVAVLGSASTALYRGQLSDGALPAGVDAGSAEAIRETVGGAVAVADRIGGTTGQRVLEQIQDAFTNSLVAATGMAAVVIVAIAILVATLLRRRTTQADGRIEITDNGVVLESAPEPVSRL